MSDQIKAPNTCVQECIQIGLTGLNAPSRVQKARHHQGSKRAPKLAKKIARTLKKL